jgi:tetratricopeptide (TPR) repeat protein
MARPKGNGRQNVRKASSDNKLPDKRDWLVLAVILVIIFIVFSPSLQNGFTNWDDDLYVTKNSAITSISFNDMNKFGDNYVGNYHPLTMFSLALDYQFFGLNPFYYHLKNIILHLLNTLLVFLFIRSLTRGNRFVPLFTALLFGIHPMHVESVTWIAERKDVLYTFYFLAGLIFYLEYLKRGKIVFLVLTAGAFVLSTLAKSAAVVFPLILFLVDYYETRKFSMKAIAEKVPFLAWSVWIGMVALRTQSASNAIGDFEYYSLLERVRFASYGYMNYLFKFLFPHKLSSFHPYPDRSNIPAVYNLAVAGIICLATYLILFGRKRKWLIFGIGFSVITLALVLQFITVGNAITAERYTYVPYIGFGFIYGILTEQLWTSERYVKYRNWIVGVITIQVLVLSVMTFNRTKVWKDSETLWTDVIKKYPEESGAYSNRGHYYRSQNRYDLALQDYNKAISLDGKNFRAYSNRGKVWFDNGDIDKALEDYNRAIEIHGDYAEALSNRGAAHARKGNFDAALVDLNKALDLEPGNINALLNRSVTWYSVGNFVRTAADVTEYLKFKPEDADMLNLRSLSYNQQNKNNEALADLNRAIQLMPSQGVFWQNRSFLLIKMGDKAGALRDIRQAEALGVKADPGYLQMLQQ